MTWLYVGLALTVGWWLGYRAGLYRAFHRDQPALNASLSRCEAALDAIPCPPKAYATVTEPDGGVVLSHGGAV